MLLKLPWSGYQLAVVWEFFFGSQHYIGDLQFIGLCVFFCCARFSFSSHFPFVQSFRVTRNKSSTFSACSRSSGGIPSLEFTDAWPCNDTGEMDSSALISDAVVLPGGNGNEQDMGTEPKLTKVIQITNIAPQATRDQMYSLFSMLGSGAIEDLRLYPSLRDATVSISARCAYIKFSDPSYVAAGQHLNNTVFIDRAIIITPYEDGDVPDETLGLQLAASSSNNISGSGRLGAKMPPHLVNRIEGVAPNDFIVTYDPNIEASPGLPQYPPLPASTASEKVEEIRRTVCVIGLDSTVSAQQCMDAFAQAGEVKYFRYCTRENDPIKYALVEFSEQASVLKALALNDIQLGMARIKVTHSLQSITKPQAKSNEAAQKEIEEAMSKVKEAQSLVSAAVDPLMGMLGGSARNSRTRSRSRSESRRSRSRGRSSYSRRSRSRDRRRRRSRSRSKDRRRRSRSRDRRRRSRSRERSSRKRSRSRSRKRSRRSRSKDRKKDSEKESGSKEQTKGGEVSSENPEQKSVAEAETKDKAEANGTTNEKDKGNESKEVSERESRKRSRSRDRKRSRSRDRREKKKKRDRSRERRKRSRSRERRRSRSKDRKERSRRSRSRSRDTTDKTSEKVISRDYDQEEAGFETAEKTENGKGNGENLQTEDMEISNSP